MKHKNIYATSAAISIAMLMATPVFADTNMSAKAAVHGGFGLGSIVRLFAGHDMSGAKKNAQHNNKDGDKHDSQKDATTTEAHAKSVVIGTVTAINGSVLTVAGRNNTAYSVNAYSASFVGAHDTTVTLSDVKVGDYVIVHGTISGTSVAADKILDGAIEAHLFLNALGAVGAGVVTSVNGSTFTVTPIGRQATTTVSTNGSTTYLVNGSATTSPSLAVGSRVLLQGTTTGDTSITASLVSIFSKGFGFFKHLFVK